MFLCVMAIPPVYRQARDIPCSLPVTSCSIQGGKGAPLTLQPPCISYAFTLKEEITERLKTGKKALSVAYIYNCSVLQVIT
jgi:hypothetical protein